MSVTPTMSAHERTTEVEQFRPPWLFRNGHVQTLAGMYVYAPRAHRPLPSSNSSTIGEVQLSDGDRLVYHDDCPASWQSGDRVVLLLHGLTGSHASPYMTRIARLLNERSMRTFRLDWRGCGAGAALARYPYHSGRSDDLAATIKKIVARCPGSPVAVIGFSLGGNVTLKMLGEMRAVDPVPAVIDRAIAVCPPIDLALTVKSLEKGWARLYDRYFCRACTRDVRQRQRVQTDAVVPDGWLLRHPKTLYEFDDTFTAPVCGFESAIDYYSQSSANQFLTGIKVPTLVIAAQDDPLIPFRQFQAAVYSTTTKLLSPRHGGHMGFCTPRGLEWLDQRLVEWTVGPQDDGVRAGQR